MAKKNIKIPIDLKFFFKSIGIEAKDFGKDVKMLCPFHSDNDPSLSVRKKDGVWNCFGCGEHGNFLDLIDHFGLGHEEFISTIEGISDTEWIEGINKILKERERKRDCRMDFENFTGLFTKSRSNKERDIKRMLHVYMKRRKFTNLTLKHFKIGLVFPLTKKNKKFHHRVLVPIHDKNGRFVWAEGRAVLDEEPRYQRPFLCGSGDYFFNYHRAVKRPEEVILVEGVLDAMMLWQRGYNAVANFGTRISDYKLNLLASFDKVIFCFDNDTKKIRGKTAMELQEEAIRRAVGRGYEVSKIAMIKGEDACSIDEKEFEYLYSLA